MNNPLTEKDGDHLQIDTGGGPLIHGNLEITGGDFVGRDQNIHITDSQAATQSIDKLSKAVVHRDQNFYIGSIKIPRWWVVILGLPLAILTVVGILIARSSNRTAENTGVIAEIASYTPTPTRTPLPAPTATPLRMPDGSFNIAIAKFASSDSDTIGDSNIVDLISRNIANFLDNHTEALSEIKGQDVLIWGPDKGIEAILPGTEDKSADGLNADAIIYGTVTMTTDLEWIIIPKFYLPDRALQDAKGQADELFRGEYALGTPVTYRPKSFNAASELNKILDKRLDALIRMLIGFSHVATGTMDGYREATNAFNDIIEKTPWAIERGTGQEILYLFLGNSYLGQSFLTEDDDPERLNLLISAQDTFSKAIGLNANYARPYTAMGSTLYQLARPLTSTSDPCAYDWQVLDESKNVYLAAINLSPQTKPVSSYVDYRANLGLGRVYFFKGVCLDESQLISAQQYLTNVIEEYKTIANPTSQQINIAAYAYGLLGFIDLQKAISQGEQTSEGHQLLTFSIDHYAQAVELIQIGKTEDGAKQGKEFMIYYLTALCFDKQGENAKSSLDEFVKFASSQSDPEKVRKYIVDRLENMNPDLWKECTNEHQQ